MLLLSTFSLFYATILALLFSPSPMALGAFILFLAFILSLILSLITSSWFALLLFLIYIGGLLVMFSYFVAICPNLPIPINSPTMTLISSFILCESLLLFTPPCLTPYTLTPPSFPSMTMLLIPTNLPLLLFLVLILFFALILVVKLSLRTSGPLRPFYPPSYDQFT